MVPLFPPPVSFLFQLTLLCSRSPSSPFGCVVWNNFLLRRQAGERAHQQWGRGAVSLMSSKSVWNTRRAALALMFTSSPPPTCKANMHKCSGLSVHLWRAEADVVHLLQRWAPSRAARLYLSLCYSTMKVLLLYQQRDWSFSHWRKPERSILIEIGDVMDCEGTSQAPSFHSLLLSVSLVLPLPALPPSHLSHPHVPISMFSLSSFLSWQAAGLLLWDEWIKTQQLPRLSTNGYYSLSIGMNGCLRFPSTDVVPSSIHAGGRQTLPPPVVTRDDTQVDACVVCRLLSRHGGFFCHINCQWQETFIRLKFPLRSPTIVLLLLHFLCSLLVCCLLQSSPTSSVWPWETPWNRESSWSHPQLDHPSTRRRKQ